MSKRSKGKYRFHSFELDIPERRFLENGSQIHLAPKEFDLLALLVENAGRLLRKEVIADTLWPNTFVEEGNISRIVHGLRKSLGQGSRSPTYIETVAKSGYRFVLLAEQIGSDEEDDSVETLQPTPPIDLDSVRTAVRSRDFEAGNTLATRYLEDAIARGDMTAVAMAYREKALCENFASNYLKSIEYSERALASLENMDDPILLGKIYSDMAQANWAIRRHEESLRLLYEAIAIIDETENIPAQIFALNNLAFFLIQHGQFNAAEEFLETGINLALESDSVYTASILDTRAEVLLRRGDVDAAIESLELAIEKAGLPEHRVGPNVPTRNLARCLLAKGRYMDAHRKAREAIRQSDDLQDRRYLMYSKVVLAEACLRLGGLAECENLLVELDGEGVGVDFFVLGDVLRIKGLKALEVADYAQAVGYFERSRAVFEKDGDVYNVAVANLALGETYCAMRRFEGVSHLTDAVTTFDRLSNEVLGSVAKATLARLKATGGNSGGPVDQIGATRD